MEKGEERTRKCPGFFFFSRLETFLLTFLPISSQFQQGGVCNRYFRHCSGSIDCNRISLLCTMATNQPMNEFISGDWVVHKFGGTSVGSADCMRQCLAIIKPITKQQRVAVVVSAMGGKPKVTDLLLDSVHAASDGRHEESAQKLQHIRDKHSACVRELLEKSPEIASRILSQIDSDLKDIQDLLRAVALMKTPHEQILELVSGYGEIWSATIMAEAARQENLPFVFLNARDVLIVREDSLGTQVDWEASELKLRAWVQKADADFLAAGNDHNIAMSKTSSVPVPHLLITGYIASSPNGVATTLKRDGSDFSASIFGRLLKASGITIWTDVSGVYSADPRKVPEAQIISEVSYTEAIELAYFGAKVIHPKTMAPAIATKVTHPVNALSTHHVNKPATHPVNALSQ